MTNNNQPDSTLPRTGERFIPGMPGTIVLEHLHRYALTREIAAEWDVLDIASGEGYGSWLMAQTAKSVVGVDISEEAVANAHARYHRDNLEFRQGSCSEIPLDSASVDLVVSFETIEHHDEHEEMLAEIKRVLRPDGVLVISTPDRRVYSDEPGHRNPYHVKEYYAHEFIDLIRRHFTHAKFFGQRLVSGSFVGPIGENAADGPLAMYHGSLDELQGAHDLPNPVYLLAVAGNTPDLPLLPFGFYCLSDRMEGPPSLFRHACGALGQVWQGTLRWLRRLVR